MAIGISKVSLGSYRWSLHSLVSTNSNVFLALSRVWTRTLRVGSSPTSTLLCHQSRHFTADPNSSPCSSLPSSRSPDHIMALHSLARCVWGSLVAINSLLPTGVLKVQYSWRSPSWDLLTLDDVHVAEENSTRRLSHSITKMYLTWHSSSLLAFP